ncbi:MAG: DNA-3-methyladenine glycosylase [Anaerolineales bacterium]
MQLRREFFARPTLQVARDLLGARLVRLTPDGTRISGVIVETEAYIGQDDLGCHARAGRTARTQVMFGLPGYAYVYFTYGMHWLFNCVTEPPGMPAAVLVRAIQPLEGIALIARRRAGRPPAQWTNGPAKLCQALGIDGACNGLDLCAPDARLFIESGTPVPEERVTTGARVGLYTVPEPWKSIPWRFCVVGESG